MHILLLNQTFHPDITATGQYLTEVAEALADRGHQVTVITSRRAYDDPGKRFAARETWKGIEVYRVTSTGFGKGAKWKRAVDFASFIISCSFRALFTRRPDVVMALTSPPLISFIGAWIAKLRRSRFIYWVMDLNPDEAIVAGWLREGSVVARLLQRMSHFSLRRADAIVALDRFMQERILAKDIPSEKIHVIAPWSHDDAVRFDSDGREQFRAAHGLANKFVVMYSGNHSPCHPLDTLLEAARILEKGSTGDSPVPFGDSPKAFDSPPIAFCFVGGGSEFAKVKRFAVENALTNVTCLPYQPLSELSASLSAADLHVVVMGNAFVGTIHPCKVYNILAVGAPLLYIGPRPSHITDIFDASQGTASSRCGSVEHGNVTALVEHLRAAAHLSARRNPDAFQDLTANFSKHTLLPQLIALFEPSQASPQSHLPTASSPR